MRIRLLAASLGLAVVGSAVQDALYLPIGEAAPPIVGKGTDGKEYSSTVLTKEKPLFVVFWKERCPHNKKASALFNALNKAYEGKVQLVGVVNAGPDNAKAWVEQFALNYPLLPDQTKAIIGAYKMRYSIGTVQIGTDGKIVKVFEGYGADQLKALNEAMAGAASTTPVAVDLTGAPGRRTWG